MNWARTCLSCQKAKVQTHIRAPLQKFAPTTRRFDHVHIDLVGPLPESQGNRYLLTVIDRFTRWPEAIPIADMETRTIAKAYVRNWVSRFGVPSQMTSDRGPQFVSEMWTAMSELLGTSLSPTTAYHPQANGLVERFHRTLKASLEARLTSPHWVDELPWVLLGLRTTPKEELNASPADLVYGAPLAVPGDFIPVAKHPPIEDHLRQLREKVGNLRPTPASAHGAENIKTNVPDSLAMAKYVFVRREPRRSLQTPYEGPYEVLERNDKYFTLQIGTHQDNFTIDRLKVALVDNELPVTVAQPPRRGRPPLPVTAAQPSRRGRPPRTDTPEPATEPLPTRPTYAEITRSGRQVKMPNRYRD